MLCFCRKELVIRLEGVLKIPAVLKSLHSICRWTFNAGKGGFVPADMRPEWAGDKFTTVDMIDLVKDKIAPRLPDNAEQAIDRVVRSIISWEACAKAATEPDNAQLLKFLAARETAGAEDMLRAALVSAQKYFDRMYK